MLQWLDQVGAEAGCSMQTQLAARAWALSSAGAGVQPHATITDLTPHPAPHLQEIDDLRKWVNSLDRVDSQGHSRRPAPCNTAATATLLPMLCLAPGSACFECARQLLLPTLGCVVPNGHFCVALVCRLVDASEEAQG